jgi:hypothetical protein
VALAHVDDLVGGAHIRVLEDIAKLLHGHAADGHWGGGGRAAGCRLRVLMLFVDEEYV